MANPVNMSARRGAASGLALLLGCAALSGCAPGLNTDGYAPSSYQQMRFSATVRQSMDSTCGSAALATILTHYWGRKTDEVEIIRILADRYPDKAVWQKRITDGFSFDDLAFAALVLGFETASAKVPLDQLKALNGPVIVHLDKGKFQHFSVLRRASGDVFYLADPTVGQMGMERSDFERQYTGHAMAIWKVGAKLPLAAPLAGVRDGMSVTSSFGQVYRDVHIPHVPIY